MSYAVKLNDGQYDILEKETDTTIELNTKEKSARDMCRKLNLGAGFNGWTPEFVAMKWKNAIYINKNKRSDNEIL